MCLYVYKQCLKDECLVQYLINWDNGESNRHFYNIFLENNLIWRNILYFNMFSRQFIFKFSDEFNSIVNLNGGEFDKHGVLFPYQVSCHFKV
jgi:hypothetical protein